MKAYSIDDIKLEFTKSIKDKVKQWFPTLLFMISNISETDKKSKPVQHMQESGSGSALPEENACKSLQIWRW